MSAPQQQPQQAASTGSEGTAGSGGTAGSAVTMGTAGAARLAAPPRPAAEPVALVPVDRSHRAVLENLGQLFRHDLSESYGLLPNDDGTFNNQRLDLFRTDPQRLAWLITAAGRLGGFAMTAPTDDGARSISDFFVVRALRRTGVGREAARQVLATAPGRWRIGFQRYNPGAERFWSLVANDAVGDAWRSYDDPPVDGRPPDSWITLTT